MNEPLSLRPLEPLGETPAGIDGHWPVEPEIVHGRDDGLGARLAYWAASGAMGLAARLPDRLLGPVLGGLAAVAAKLDRRHTRAARAFLRQAFPELEGAALERAVRRSYAHLFDVVVSGQRLGRRAPGPWVFEGVEVLADERVHELRRRGGGAVFVTAHLGDWELGSALMPWLGFAPLYVIGKPPKNRFLSEAMLRAREARGIRVLPRRGAMALAPAVVGSGGTLAMLLDQRAATKPVLVPFFGRPARSDRSAGVLLRRLGVPVVLGFCLRLEGHPRRYRLELGPVLEPSELAGQGPEAIAARLHAEFERRIRAHPEQYFWLHDRFRDTPTQFDGPAPAPAGAAPPARPSPR